MKQTKELIVRRVAGIQAIPSLRYDTRDNDTTFNFVDVGKLLFPPGRFKSLPSVEKLPRL